ncbi:MAG: hypothetical protein MZW92_55240 [Comamonadaceae bacterium]|nr:hypothetical protein [Comamonadaceae bacterium]
MLHTHSRALEFHPHVHLALPAASAGARPGGCGGSCKTGTGLPVQPTRPWPRCSAASCWLA